MFRSSDRPQSRKSKANVAWLGVFACLLALSPACSGGAHSALLSTIETASKRVAEADAYLNDIDRSIEKLIAMGNWDMDSSSFVRQERERIRIEHDELMSRCLALKFEAGEKTSSEHAAPLADKAKDALARADAHLAKTRAFRNSLESFRSWTERLSANIAVCQTYTNQMHANLQSLAPTKDEAPQAIRDKITLFQARYEALKAGENAATGLARASLQQFFSNPQVAEPGSRAALDQLSKLQNEIRDFLVEMQPLFLEATAPPGEDVPDGPK